MNQSNNTKLLSVKNVDEQTIRLACEGNKIAMEMIYKTYASRIFGLLYRMSGNRETAQELMQDSFIDVLRNISTFRAESSFYTWVRRIAVNRCLMHFRKHKAQVYELTETNEPKFESDSDSKLDTEKLLNKLSPKRRMIVWLHEVEGLTHKEIAEMMGKSVSFSKTEMSRALQQLRQDYGVNFSNENSEKKTAINVKQNISKSSEVGICTPLLNNS